MEWVLLPVTVVSVLALLHVQITTSTMFCHESEFTVMLQKTLPHTSKSTDKTPHIYSPNVINK